MKISRASMKKTTTECWYKDPHLVLGVIVAVIVDIGLIAYYFELLSY